MTTSASLIATDIDFERVGFQTGTLRLPWSHDRSAYGHIPIPIAVCNAGAGTGPTVLLTGGNHGDEYEGPVALMKLLQRLPATALLDQSGYDHAAPLLSVLERQGRPLFIHPCPAHRPPNVPPWWPALVPTS